MLVWVGPEDWRTKDVACDCAAQLFLLSIGERAEALAQQYEDRHLATQEALAAFEALAGEYTQAEQKRRRLGLDPNAFALYTALRPFAPELTAAQARLVDALFAQYPEAGWNAQQSRGWWRRLGCASGCG